MPTWLPTVSFVCEWRDLWIGAFVDTAKRRLYILPLPCLGVMLQWPVPKAKRCARPVVHPEHRKVVIVAHSYAQAREYARVMVANDRDWRYANQMEHLYGYRDIDLILLPGWEADKGWEFVTAVRRLERENTKHV